MAIKNQKHPETVRPWIRDGEGWHRNGPPSAHGVVLIRDPVKRSGFTNHSNKSYRWNPQRNKGRILKITHEIVL